MAATLHNPLENSQVIYLSQLEVELQIYLHVCSHVAMLLSVIAVFYLPSRTSTCKAVTHMSSAWTVSGSIGGRVTLYP